MTQSQLAAGAPTLTKRLVKIFNKSICEGQFPMAWKEAIVTLVLKKGDKSEKENYRPIKRLSNHISKDRLERVADSLYMSKIRYGVQLYGNVRMNEEDPEQNC